MSSFLELLLTFIVAIPFIYFLIVLYLAYFGSNYLPTPGNEVAKMMSFIQKDDIVWDLGFGDGRVIQAASEHGASQVYGCELDFFRYIRTRRKLGLLNTHNTHLYWQDIWSTDVRQANVVFTFFAPKLMSRLYKKIHNETKKGTWFVAYKHPVPDVKPTKVMGNVFAYRM